jgi:Protein of unknown function (DUF2917)
MQLNFSSAAPLRLQVNAGQVLTLPRADNLSLEAVNGAFWITCDNRQRDHVLQPGERIHLAHSRKVVLEALEPGVIQLLVPTEVAAVDSSVPAAAAREAVCMRQHVQEERLQYRSLEFA